MTDFREEDLFASMLSNRRFHTRIFKASNIKYDGIGYFQNKKFASYALKY